MPPNHCESFTRNTQIDNQNRCVGRRRETDRDETVCLFVLMAQGKTFSLELRERIINAIRKELSPRHVPGVVEECGAGIPKTGNGKKFVYALSINFRVVTNDASGSRSQLSRSYPASASRRMLA